MPRAKADPADQDTSEAGRPDPAPASGDMGASQLQKQFDEAHAQGFFGSPVDPTPRENYTFSGVLAGKPTPETDHKAAVEAVKVLTVGREGVQPPA